MKYIKPYNEDVFHLRDIFYDTQKFYIVFFACDKKRAILLANKFRE